jgi:hypothetical protein
MLADPSANSTSNFCFDPADPQRHLACAGCVAAPCRQVNVMVRELPGVGRYTVAARDIKAGGTGSSMLKQVSGTEDLVPCLLLVLYVVCCIGTLFG